MSDHMEEGALDGLMIVCPSCDDLLRHDASNGKLEAGVPIRLFCPACERTVEVTAPEGIQALGTGSTVDRATVAPASEFVAARPDGTGT